MTPIQRFMAKVEQGSNCWQWKGAMRGSRQKRGCFWGGKKNVDAARWMFSYSNPDVSIEGLVVRHTCDNPLCVNPAHLIVGTQADNVSDMWERGRANLDAIRQGAAKGRAMIAATPDCRPRGERHGIHKRDVAGESNPNASLTAQQAAEIARRGAQGESQRSLALAFGVHQKTVWSILNGRSYLLEQQP
jgi:DNA-binding CsgD family transcriptional regulator